MYLFDVFLDLFEHCKVVVTPWLKDVYSLSWSTVMTLKMSEFVATKVNGFQLTDCQIL